MTTAGGTSIGFEQRGVNRGMIAVGTHINQSRVDLTVRLAPGDPASIDALAEVVDIRALPRPVRPTVDDFPGLVGRAGDLEALAAALAAGRAAALLGPDGIGKSVLLRHLVHRPPAGSWPDGIVHLPARGQFWEDVAGELLRALFALRLPIHLGRTVMAQHLGPVAALVAVDDVSPDAGIEDLVAMASGSSFVLAAPEPLPRAEARWVRLEGLPAEAAPQLVAAALAMTGETEPLDTAGVAAAARIGQTLGGHPGRIVRSVQDARWSGQTLAALADELEAPTGAASTPTAPASPVLDDPERAVAATLVALDGAAVGPERLAAISGTDPAATARLDRRGAIRAASPRFRLAPGVAEALPPVTEAEGDAIRLTAARHYATWAARPETTPAEIADEAEAIRRLVEWAERTDQPQVAIALVRAVEPGLVAADRWGTWRRITAAATAAAERIGDAGQVAWGRNAGAVIALADGDAQLARAGFEAARDAWATAGQAEFAEVARHNVEVVNGLIAGPPSDLGGEGDGSGLDVVRPRPGPSPWRRLAIVGGAVAVIVVAVLVVVAVLARPAELPDLAIDPGQAAFAAPAVGDEGDTIAFDVANQGMGTAAIDVVTVRGANLGDFPVTSDGCTADELAEGDSCEIGVQFLPIEPGRRSAELVVIAGDLTVAAGLAGEADQEVREALADLVAERFALVGEPIRFRRSPAWQIPVQLVAGNTGDAPAGPFRIAVLRGDGKTFVPLLDPNDESPREVLDVDGLEPGDIFTWGGFALVAVDSVEEARDLVLQVDWCGAPPGDPQIACEVVEPDEGNNVMGLQFAPASAARPPASPNAIAPKGP